MKKMIGKLLLSSIILWPLHALSASSPTPPVIQPAPAPLGSEWLVVTDVEYKNGKLRNCKTVIFEYENKECSKWFTPQELIDLKIGKNNTAIGIAPFLSYHGQLRGVVIYYKQTENK